MVFLDISAYGMNVGSVEECNFQSLVDNPHNLSHVKVLLYLGAAVVAVHGIDAEQIEGKAFFGAGKQEAVASKNQNQNQQDAIDLRWSAV